MGQDIKNVGDVKESLKDKKDDGKEREEIQNKEWKLTLGELKFAGCLVNANTGTGPINPFGSR